MTLLRWTTVALAATLAGCSDEPTTTPQDAGADVAGDLGADDVAEAPDAGADAGEDDVPTPVVSFAEVQALFTRTCITDACHGRSGSGALRLTNAALSHAALVDRPADQVPSVQLVAPGDPDNSYLVMKVEGTMRQRLPRECATSPGRNPCGAQMPQLAAPLTQAERALIRNWIIAGALAD